MPLCRYAAPPCTPFNHARFRAPVPCAVPTMRSGALGDQPAGQMWLSVDLGADTGTSGPGGQPALRRAWALALRASVGADNCELAAGAGAGVGAGILRRLRAGFLRPLMTPSGLSAAGIESNQSRHGLRCGQYEQTCCASCAASGSVMAWSNNSGSSTHMARGMNGGYCVTRSVCAGLCGVTFCWPFGVCSSLVNCAGE